MPSYEDIYGPSTPAVRVGATSGAFDTKLGEVADRLGMNREDLRAVMAFETGGTMDPAVRNQAGSGATGLIQFMPKTAQGLGTTTEALARMAPEQQLDYVEKYFAPYKGKLRSLGDVYMAVLHPASIGKTESATLFHREQTPTAYQQNAALDKDKKGYVTVGDAVSAVKRFVRPGVAEAATAPRGIAYEDIYGSPPQAATQVPGGTPPPGPGSQAPPLPSTSPRPQEAPPAPVATPEEAAGAVARLRARQAEAATPEARLQRFQQMPAVTALSPEERQAAVAEFQGMNEAQQRAVLTSEPSADLPTAMQEGSRPTPEQQLRPRPAILPSQVEPPLTEGITKPSTMIPLLTGLGTARVALTPLSRLLIEPATQTLAEAGGRWWETGKTPTPGEALETFAWNLLPSAGQEALRAGGRGVLRRGAGGQMIARDEAARQSQGLGVRVMQAPEREALSEAFDEIARTGIKLDMTPVRMYWGTLATTERQRALQEMRRISSPLADVLEKTGGTGLKGWDIGELQHVRSELLKRRQMVTTPETKDLLYDLRGAVDDAIEQGIAVGKVPAGFAPERLQEAQAGWRKMRQAEDLQGLVTKHTSFNQNTQYSDLNLAALNKELQGTTKRSQRLLASMTDGQRDALKAEIKALARNYPFIKIPSLAHIVTTGGSLTTAGIMLLSGQPGAAVAAAIPASLSLALQSPKAMSLFRDAILRDRGELKPNTIALILDTARRELGMGPQGEPTGAAASGSSR